MNRFPELQLAEVARHRLLAVRLDVDLERVLLLEPLAALLAHDGRRRVRVEPQHVDPQLGLVGEGPVADRALVVGLGLGPLPTPVVLLLVFVGRVQGGEPLAAVGAHDLLPALPVDPAHVDLGKVGVLEGHVAQQARVRAGVAALSWSGLLFNDIVRFHGSNLYTTERGGLSFARF